MLIIVSLKILATIVFPLLLIIFSLNGLREIISSTLLLKIRIPVKKSTFIIIPFFLIYSVFLLLSSTISGIMIAVLFFSAAVIYPVNIVLRTNKAGIYREGIVISNGQYRWNTIEGYIVIETGIRFIHKETGAFDVNIEKKLIVETERVLSDIGIRKIT